MRNISAAVVLGMLGTASLAPAVLAPELDCVVNSAASAGATVEVDADVAAVPLDPTTDNQAWLHYSTNNQATWTTVPMTAVGLPGFDSTFAATFTAPGSGAVRYYVSARTGLNYATGAPENAANAWPPPGNLLAPAADEPPGDCINNPRGPWLDLTGVEAGWSSTHIYGRLTNDHTSWPLNSGLLGPWYIYSVGFRNPAAPSDSYAFVMSCANVFGVYTSALYEINQLTEDYTVIGDVDVDSGGNRLSLRCRIADLVARPRFGPWPNDQGYLTKFQGSTQSANISQQHFSHDTSDLCRFYAARLPGFTVGQNQPPVLSRPRVVPDSGTSETNFWFNVLYSDADSNLPRVRAVAVGPDTIDLRPSHHRYWASVSYDGYRAGFGPGWHRFRFIFNDGVAAVTSPLDSFHVTGTGIAEGAGPAAPVFSAVPNPFSARVELAAPRAWGEIRVRDCAGRLVRVLRPGDAWDGRDDTGRDLGPGIYFACPAGANRPRLRLVRAGR